MPVAAPPIKAPEHFLVRGPSHANLYAPLVDAHGPLGRRHRFDALALDRHQQSQAVIMHWLLPIGTASTAPNASTKAAKRASLSWLEPLSISVPIRMKTGPILYTLQ